MYIKDICYQRSILNFWEKEPNKKHSKKEKKWYLNFNIIFVIIIMNIIKYVTKNWMMILMVVLFLLILNMTIVGNSISLREVPGTLRNMIVVEGMSGKAKKDCVKGKDCTCK